MKQKDKYIISAIGVLLLTSYLVKKHLFNSEWIQPVTGKLTSGFGIRIDPITKKPHLHNGQDIAVPIGTKVKAPYSGVVSSVTPSIEGGNQIIIKHNNGWQTGYAHLSKVLVSKGSKVNKGDVIALSGNTGKHTTGAHLHFTMTDPKGSKVDPRKIVYT